MMMSFIWSESVLCEDHVEIVLSGSIVVVVEGMSFVLYVGKYIKFMLKNMNVC